MGWLYLAISAILEIIWFIALESSKGFSRLKPSIITVIAMIANGYFLSLTLKYLPSGTTYVIWTGSAAIGITVYGMIAQNETRDLIQIFCIFMIIIGVVGLKLTTSK